MLNAEDTGWHITEGFRFLKDSQRSVLVLVVFQWRQIYWDRLGIICSPQGFSFMPHNSPPWFEVSTQSGDRNTDESYVVFAVPFVVGSGTVKSYGYCLGHANCLTRTNTIKMFHSCCCLSPLSWKTHAFLWSICVWKGCYSRKTLLVILDEIFPKTDFFHDMHHFLPAQSKIYRAPWSKSTDVN